MALNTQMSPTEVRALDQQVNTFNTQLKAKQQVVSKNSLDEADFLTLLVTQLKTQDPTKPMNDKEFIGQMTQFTSLKQMSSVAENMAKFTREFDFTKSVGIIGKEITWTDQAGFERRGFVDSVVLKNDQAFLKSDGVEIALSEVTAVSEGEAAIAEMVQRALTAGAH